MKFYEEEIIQEEFDENRYYRIIKDSFADGVLKYDIIDYEDFNLKYNNLTGVLDKIHKIY